MGKSSGGVKGYRYYTSLVLMLGNRVEWLLGVNFDKKGWQHPKDTGRYMQAGNYIFDLPELYGETEGGVSGVMSFYDGNAAQMPNPHYQQYYSLAPAYRHQSYIVFQDFYVGNSPYLKDVMFFPKRTRIKNNGQDQWYKERADGEIVCEIDAERLLNIPTPLGNCSFYYKYTQGCLLDAELTEWSRGHNFTKVIGEPTGEYPKGDIVPDPTGSSSAPRPGCLTSYTSERKNGHYEFKHIYNGGGFVVVSIDFYVPEGNASGVDLYTENEVQEIRDIENGKITYVFRDRAPCEISAIWKVKSIKTNSEVSPWFYRYGLGFFYMHQTNKSSEMQAVDINPIHKAREIITDYTAMNKPESDVNDENFRAAADRIWDEGLGISWAIQEKSCKDALDELAAHIEGGFRINRQTGLYEVILFRDDLLDLENALHFDESNIKHLEFESYYAEDAVNSYNVSYYDRENLKDSTFSIDDTGLIHTVGFVNAEKLDFPYFMNRRNAEIVANWKLKQVSTAAWKGSFTTGRYEARKLNKFDVILLSWQSKQLLQLPVRVLNISLGDGKDNTVTIDFIEVVSYSENMNAQINGDESMSKVLEPQPNNAVVFEAPYYNLVQQNGQATVNLELGNNADAGYLIAAVSKPQNNSMYASVYTDKATEDYTQMQKVGAVDYCPSLTLDQDISFTESAFIIKNANAISQAKEGTLILLDDELLVYQNYDTQTKLLTVKRASFDTVPQPHLKDAVFYFFDDFHFLDTEQYVSGETVQVQVLTTTPSAVQKRDPVDVKKLELNSRAIRPYPPANVQINSEHYPTEIDSDLILTWVDRNRLQQTGGAILGYFDDGVTLENGVNYQLILTEFDANQTELRTQSINVGQLNSYTFAASAIQANTFAIEITLKSLRDDYECFQSFAHTVELSRFYSAPYDLTVEFKND
ncbi:phage tail protein [Acinetobacter sp. CFCC 10889]|uniref:phage tail protein n=1 Tax=Acinetobacter sp. CFCC 10889 TaxID=1775557 RepID=UPI000DD00AF3|nr:phage tail protein [Acinetobacter sp. CFCC 10889]